MNTRYILLSGAHVKWQRNINTDIRGILLGPFPCQNGR